MRNQNDAETYKYDNLKMQSFLEKYKTFSTGFNTLRKNS
jgi:hypothetical protein